MAFVQKLFTSYHGYDDGESRIGEINRIWYDSTTNTLRISDGVTPGGTIIGGSGGGGSYTLPTASSTVLGGVKIGSNITITNGVISVAAPFSGSYNDLTNKPNISIPQIKLTFSYSDLPTSPIGTVPAGAIIKEVCIILLTAFDATSTLSVGSTANHTELMDTTDITTRATGTYTTEPAHKYTNNTDLVLSITAGSSTQGNGIVIVYYE